jgi:hypothetical protein
MHLTPPHVFCGRLWRSTPRLALVFPVIRMAPLGAAVSMQAVRGDALVDGGRSRFQRTVEEDWTVSRPSFARRSPYHRSSSVLG